MRTLAIDCATSACSVALFEGEALLAGSWEEIGRGHAERLVPLIAALPDRGRAERICVSLGPGSFTGVRIGLAAARALGLAWGARVLGYPTLALLAAMARTGGKVPVSVAMLGGHGEWFVQDFSAEGWPQGELVSLPPGPAARHAHHSRVVGTAAEALVELRGTGSAKSLLPDARRLPELPEAQLTTALALLYGRAPDAKVLASREPAASSSAARA